MAGERSDVSAAALAFGVFLVLPRDCMPGALRDVRLRSRVRPRLSISYVGICPEVGPAHLCVLHSLQAALTLRGRRWLRTKGGGGRATGHWAAPVVAPGWRARRTPSARVLQARQSASASAPAIQPRRSVTASTRVLQARQSSALCSLSLSLLLRDERDLIGTISLVVRRARVHYNGYYKTRYIRV